jgi:hypothetical protein
MVRVGTPRTGSSETDERAFEATGSAISLEDAENLLGMTSRGLVKALIKRTLDKRTLGIGWGIDWFARAGLLLVLKGPSLSSDLVWALLVTIGFGLLNFTLMWNALGLTPEGFWISQLVIFVGMTALFVGMHFFVGPRLFKKAYREEIRPFLALVFPLRHPTKGTEIDLKATWSRMEPCLWALAQMPEKNWEKYLERACADAELRKSILLFARIPRAALVLRGLTME